jgi:hypothetical protein
MQKVIQIWRNHKISLTDASSLNGRCVNNEKYYVSLKLTKLLEIGNTWYSTFGFQSENSKQLEDSLYKVFIEKQISQFFSFVKPDESFRFEAGMKIKVFVRKHIDRILRQEGGVSDELCRQVNELNRICYYLNYLALLFLQGTTTWLDTIVVEERLKTEILLGIQRNFGNQLKDKVKDEVKAEDKNEYVNDRYIIGVVDWYLTLNYSHLVRLPDQGKVRLPDQGDDRLPDQRGGKKKKGIHFIKMTKKKFYRNSVRKKHNSKNKNTYKLRSIKGENSRRKKNKRNFCRFSYSF